MIEFQHTFFIAGNVSSFVLTDDDVKLLKSHGIDPDQFKSELTPFQQEFYFGRLAAVLGAQNARKVTYNDLKKYIRRGQYIPLSRAEQEALRSLETKTYNYIKGLGQNISTFIENKLLDENLARRDYYESVIRDATKRAIVERESARSVMAEIGKKTGDWQRDLGRIAETEMQNAYETGKALAFKEISGSRVKNLYKQVYPGACFPIRDTEFLTIEGFKKLDEIKEGDLAATFNLESEELEYKPVKSVIRYFYEGEMHLYKNNHIDHFSTPDHNLLVNRKKGSLRWNELIPSKDARMLGWKDQFHLTSRWRGSEEKFLHIAGKSFDSENFSEFLGWFLSEGNVTPRRKTSSGKTNSTIISIAQEKPENRILIKECLEKTFPENKAYECAGGIKIILDRSFDKFVIWLKSLGNRSYEKFIPENVKALNKQCLEKFLVSYIRGDGYGERFLSEDILRGKGSLCICTASKRMADDLCEIVLKCGFNPSLSVKDWRGRIAKKKNGKSVETKTIIYRIRVCKWKTVKHINKFFTKIESWKGDVGCLEMERNSTIFIRRNGRMMWTGNCKHCIRLYLTDGIGSEPRLFSYEELAANSTNVGRNVNDWKPTIYATHPYCRCDLRIKRNSKDVWNDKKGIFEPEPVKDKVKSKGDIKIVVGDKTFIV